MLARLPSYAARRAGAGARCPTCPRYLSARGRRVPARRRARARRRALQAFLAAMWADATDFIFDAAALRERLRRARGRRLRRLLAVGRARARRGARDRVRRGRARRRARARARRDARRGARRPARTTPHATVAVLALESADGGRPRARGRRPPPAPPADRAAPVGRRRAVARPDRLGAHRRRPVDGGPARHRPAPPGRATACSPPRRRTRCARSARSSPAARRAPASWPGRCAASSSAASARARVEALTDWLLARRRCSPTPDALGYERRGRAARGDLRRGPATARRSSAALREAISLERAAIAGFVRPRPEVDALVAELGGCLRAVLRDVLCGHLDPDLRRVADELIAESPEPA